MLNAARRTRIEALVTRRARAFDLESLLAALTWLGYEEGQIRFRGSSEPKPPSSVVESIRFEQPAGEPRRVVVTLNLGLSPHQGFLPSYFEAVAESLAEPEHLYKFLEFFEHGLLRDFVHAVSPEQHPGWSRLRDTRFEMLGLTTVSTLDWLFRLTFPELGIAVRRADLRTRTDAHAVILGHSKLDGSTVLGTTYSSGQGGFSVELFTDNEHTATGRTWWAVAHERLDKRILPHLKGSEHLLEVVLVVAEHASWAKLDQDTEVGYDRIRGSAREHHVWVHRGETSGAPSQP